MARPAVIYFWGVTSFSTCTFSYITRAFVTWPILTRVLLHSPHAFYIHRVYQPTTLMYSGNPCVHLSRYRSAPPHVNATFLPFLHLLFIAFHFFNSAAIKPRVKCRGSFTFCRSAVICHPAFGILMLHRWPISLAKRQKFATHSTFSFLHLYWICVTQVSSAILNLEANSAPPVRGQFVSNCAALIPQFLLKQFEYWSWFCTSAQFVLICAVA